MNTGERQEDNSENFSPNTSPVFVRFRKRTNDSHMVTGFSNSPHSGLVIRDGCPGECGPNRHNPEKVSYLSKIPIINTQKVTPETLKCTEAVAVWNKDVTPFSNSPRRNFKVSILNM